MNFVIKIVRRAAAAADIETATHTGRVESRRVDGLIQPNGGHKQREIMTSGAVERVAGEDWFPSLLFAFLPSTPMLTFWDYSSCSPLAISVRFLAHCVNGFYCILQHLFKILNRRNGREEGSGKIDIVFIFSGEMANKATSFKFESRLGVREVHRGRLFDVKNKYSDRRPVGKPWMLAFRAHHEKKAQQHDEDSEDGAS